jgi:cyclic dehypoxanthinyl futalosine synthase
LTQEEGLFLYRTAELLELGEVANAIRFQKNPERSVTFVIDTNPNYTNVCNVDCHFCAFYRRPGDPDAYTHSVEQVMEIIAQTQPLGVTTVLLQGGVNPDLPFDYYVKLVKTCKERFPQVTPHFFSAPEVQMMAKVSGLSLEEIFRQLKEAGQTTFPGGGAEIITKRIRDKVSPKKGGPETWLDVHRAAHNVGIRSTATMMFGHRETDEDIVEHLTLIRDLQDDTGGFTAFIPWSFKPDNTRLKRWVPQPAGPVDYLKILSFSRIFLDNFDHIQASWFSEGKKVGQIALHFGCDDFGGTLFDENVHAATGHINKSTVDEMCDLIRESGFIPVQRDTLYNKIRVWEKKPRLPLLA